MEAWPLKAAASRFRGLSRDIGNYVMVANERRPRKFQGRVFCRRCGRLILDIGVEPDRQVASVHLRGGHDVAISAGYDQAFATLAWRRRGAAFTGMVMMRFPSLMMAFMHCIFGFVGYGKLRTAAALPLI